MSYIEEEIYIVVDSYKKIHNIPLFELVIAKKFKDDYIKNDNTYVLLCGRKKYPNGEYWQILRDTDVVKFFK